MRKTLGRFALLALCVLVANAALAGHITRRGVAQPALQTIFNVEAPAAGETVFGIVEVRGFILDGRGVSRITLLVDGAPVHDADINQPRPDVRRKYPRFFGEDFPVGTGFVTSFLASNYTDGSHTVGLRVTYSDSEVIDLAAVSVIVDNTINQAPLGALDSPGGPNIYVSGVYPITGWVIDAEGIRTTTGSDGKVRADIEVMVDDMVAGQAIYPLPRPDVAIAHPDVATAFNSGFQMNLDTTRFTNGFHTISVRVWDTNGMSQVIGSTDVWLENNYATLGPFGRIDWPMSNAHFYSTGCFTANPPSGIEYNPGDNVDWVSGWVVDQNDNSIFEGVVGVELLINGVPIKNTATDCGPVTRGGVTFQANCYGNERSDILYQYPQFGMDAKYAGYFFDVNTRYYLQTGQLHLGLNILGVQARTRDSVRPAVIINEVPIIVNCDTRGINPAYGELEVPVAMQDMKNTQLVKGWVIDFPGGVQRLNFYVDGILDGSLIAGTGVSLGLPRSDVPAKYPWLPYPDSYYSGFEYNLDTAKYVDGVHQLVIQAVGYNGGSNFWVQRPIVFNNAN
jgi:N-acetylmuramoyl-L-alanine amidase